MVPCVPPGTVARTTLGDRLEALLTRDGSPVMLVTGPAGFGKTTLLSSWAQALQVVGRPVAWCSLDESDVSCFRFWSTVLTALEAAGPELQGRVRHLSAPQAAGDVDFLTEVVDASPAPTSCWWWRTCTTWPASTPSRT